MATITKVEAEISLAWARQNPDKFLDSVAEFREDYVGWGLKIDTSREGFLVLAARREPIEPLDLHVMSDHVRLSQIKFLLQSLAQDDDIGLSHSEIINKALELSDNREVR